VLDDRRSSIIYRLMSAPDYVNHRFYLQEVGILAEAIVPRVKVTQTQL
jgi:hypothetical protein